MVLVLKSPSLMRSEISGLSHGKRLLATSRYYQESCCMPRLPMELYNTDFLWRIGSGLGTMLKVDHLTSIHSKGQYVCIYVEI